jgi:predicted acylesterase/phospholipase RssA
MRVPKLLLFSSGSVLTIGYIGALQVLDASGALAAVTTYAGVSAGALIATCLAIGYSIAELEDVITRMDFSAIQDITAEDSPINLFTLYGADSGERLHRFIRAIMRVKGYAETTTFADLVAAGRPGLVIWATEMETGRLRRFCATTTPTYTVCGALRASVCIPLLFAPVVAEDTGHLLVDGGVLNHYPIAYLSPEEREAALGFYARTLTEYAAPADIMDYMKMFVGLILRSKNDDTPDIFRGQTILLELDARERALPMSFHVGAEEKEELLSRGREAARSWLSVAAEATEATPADVEKEDE